MKKITFSLLVLHCSLFYLSVANGQDDNMETALPLINLTIKPNICVAPRGESQCISSIDISWSSSVPADYCLHVDTGLLRCWQQAQQGEYRHKINISEKLNCWLTHDGVATVLAQSSVKFAALKPHRKQMRRRSRLPWSIHSL